MLQAACFLAAMVWFQAPMPGQALLHDALSFRPLPAWCYDPPGSDCSWYKDCLEARFSCPTDNYALEYGEKMCNKFDTEKHSLSALGRTWVDSVRGCLQKELVPVLNKTMSCSEVKAYAFNTHVVCYVHPPFGGPSYCDLPLTDYLKIWWTVKGVFVKEPKVFMKLAAEILKGCASRGRNLVFG